MRFSFLDSLTLRRSVSVCIQHLLLTCPLWGCAEAYAQDQQIVDSLHGRLLQWQQQRNARGRAAFTRDTGIVRVYSQLIKQYIYKKNDSVMLYGQKALELSQTIGYAYGKGVGYNSIGFALLQQGEADSAKQHLQKALDLRREIRDYPGICNTLHNLSNLSPYSETFLRLQQEALAVATVHHLNDEMAAAYHNIGMYYQNSNQPVVAVEYYLKAKQINEQPQGNQRYLMLNLLMLGNVYSGELVKHAHAEAYYAKALQIARTLHDKQFEISFLSLLANCSADLKQYERAVSRYLESIQKAKEIGDEGRVHFSYVNLGDTYYTWGKYREALHYDTLAFRYYQEKDPNPYLVATAATNIGKVYNQFKDYRKSLSYAKMALSLTDSNTLDLLTSIHLTLSVAYTGLGEFKSALTHHQLHKQYYDSLYNNENKEKILQVQMQSDFEKKEANLKAKQEKKDMQQRSIRNAIAAGLVLLSVFFVVVYRQRNKVKKEKERSDELLLNILPAEVADELKAKGSADSKLIDEVTVLFTDFKGFTQLSEKLTPKELVEEINECFSAFDHIMQQYGVEKIKTIGDAYMAAGGLPSPNDTHAMDVANAAMAIQQFMLEHKQKKEAKGKLYFDIRIGIHTGPVVAGIVGVKKFAYDIWGDTVNTASRMESSGEAGKVNISGTTYDRVKHQFNCVHRGKVTAKGKGEIDMYFVEGKKIGNLLYPTIE